jgi:hypothetical protein
MKKIVFFLILAFYLTSAFIGNNKESYECKLNIRSSTEKILIWDSIRKLEWEDFKGIPIHIENVSDSSYAHFNTISEVKILKNNSLEVSVKVFFNIEKSWVLKKTDLSLKYKQLLFDIFELECRKLRKKVKKNKKEKVKYGIPYSLTNKLYNNNIKHIDVFDNIKRSEKDFEERNKKITKELADLKEYASPVFIMK